MMKTAEDEMRRALMALRLEVDGGIVDDVTKRCDAAMAAARAEGKVVARGIEAAACIAERGASIAYEEHDKPTAGHVAMIGDQIRALAREPT